MARQKIANYDRLPEVKRGPGYFLESIVGLGVGLRIEGNRLIAYGEGVSTVLQAEIDKRAGQLIALLATADLLGGVLPRVPRKAKAKAPDKLQLIRNGIEGAKKQQAKRKAVTQARRRAYA